MNGLRRALRPPGGSYTWLVAGMVGMVVWLTIRSPQDWQNPALATVYVVSLVAAAGMWRRQNWARWLTIVFFGALAVYCGVLLARHFTWMRLASATCMAWAIWVVWSEPFATDDSGDSDAAGMMSLVALCRALPYVDAGVIARAASTAFGRTVRGEGEAEENSDATDDFVVGESPLFILMTAGRMFLIHHQDQPYVDDPEAAAEGTWEMRHQAVIRDHRAWMSVDLMRDENAEQPSPGAENYARIGKLLAELIDETCLGILCPAEGKLFVFDDETESHLKSDDPLAALDGSTQAPMIEIADDDPRMLAAVAEARQRWDEFVAAFQNRGGNEQFFVKYPLRSGDEVEFIWAKVTAVENDVVFGLLANDPLHPGKKINDRVRIPVSEINDWNYLTPEGEMVGGFTIRVLMEASRNPKPRRRDDVEVDDRDGEVERD